ncbi:alpha/beta fold hydrolase [Mesorhizobium japonicum]|uniref:Mlr2262 protein n=1 Tax=Mesorhizobium japonicum (strain LMG 29417 / CECT 9101 / MAFF 303099) TaxID=266835 RepID=Q98IT3_RHILO|nr:alpha/beta fold hydrolase [Mesorhizobium japonicum]BAB49433.1 mlr2262 [Mesorhizobium japonicum MAFF 303099]
MDEQAAMTHTAVSRANRVVSWESHGTGPGLVVLHGAARAAHHYRPLAKALSHRFTVHLVNRNGRGLSAPATPEKGIAGQVDDVAAVFEATRAAYLFGHSAGGMVALEAARVVKAERMAVYDPGISIDGSFPSSLLNQLTRDLELDDLAAAQTHLAKAVGVLPAWLPDFALRWLFGKILSGDGGAELRQLLPTLRDDLGLIEALAGPATRFDDIRMPTLVIWGSKSPAFLVQACKQLAAALPQAQSLALAGQGHNAPDLTGTAAVARLLEQVFMPPTAPAPPTTCSLSAN